VNEEEVGRGAGSMKVVKEERQRNGEDPLKVLSSEMDPAQIRLIR
jgi:hypothetical protein